MKQKNYSKPTINQLASSVQEVRIVIGNMIREIEDLKTGLASYVAFKNDNKKWVEWINKQVKESQDTKFSNKKTPTSLKEKKVG